MFYLVFPGRLLFTEAMKVCLKDGIYDNFHFLIGWFLTPVIVSCVAVAFYFAVNLHFIPEF